MTEIRKSLTAAAVLLALPSPALAYIGPGAGLSAIGTVVAVVGAFLLLVAGFVWYPVRRMIRRRRETRKRANEG
jgi:hypothetical protein